ncbi:CRISPR system precrRNA processing endoribonuclease RAMP protein Cas6 [Sulfolobus islandicus]|uniref:CRISPR-associated protein, Cas6 n=1 Tax=Saccharolobus islandicus (strain HVE10/4) TaxID=930943 RepID=F0NNT0_SACI0|nr:CRISPR system precrRNA processing endoribonuclease RAMP protein Cas6 [Sulfolobus islandicus]ADX82116.1 CRISPR-associated protein, Cas6 [Sulfolobus islandicus HVE10/4]WCM36546.1 CRISPR system precrRNA processing endoribonuclease RAMP protein Cas6 [Sulfolobus islandicus]
MPLIRLKLSISPFITTDFTGKFVKSFFIAANRELEEIFEDKKYPSPKPLRITPLLEEKKEVPIYSKVINRPKPKDNPSPISIGGVYYVYLGYEQSLEPKINLTVAKLLGGVQLEYGKKVNVKLLEYERIENDVPKDFNSVKIYFISPAIFVDPFVKVSQIEKDRVKRFIPFPPLIFSVNVYELFKDKYKRNIIRLSYSLVESHTVLNTVSRVWYYYDGKWLPGVIGYVKFFLRKNIHKYTKIAIRKILQNAIEMGVGSGRAAGFGFVKMKFDEQNP